MSHSAKVVEGLKMASFPSKYSKTLLPSGLLWRNVEGADVLQPGRCCHRGSGGGIVSCLKPRPQALAGSLKSKQAMRIDRSCKPSGPCTITSRNGDGEAP